MTRTVPDPARRRLLLDAGRLAQACAAGTIATCIAPVANRLALGAPAPPTNPRLNGKSAASAPSARIPSIAWIPRSDWINARTDINPPAKGDGKTDDTRALQRALKRIGPRPGDPKVVYLPAGTYRITETLVLRRRTGGMLVGDGSRTIILWSGRRAGRMFWSDGATYQSYLGLVWDGAGRAAVGIDHASTTFYETRVLHEYMEFRNFADSGIRVGHNQKVASAEMVFSNLSFRNNRNGVSFLSWNDYNNIFDGCEFSGNGCAVRVEKGNVVVRNTHFESSRDCDLLLSTHSHSVRRSVSVGSNTFIRTVRGPIANGLVRVEDCRIDGWKDRRGAIIAGLRGPILVFDTAFTTPPGPEAPIRLDNPIYMNQIALLSNVTSPGTKEIIDAGPNGIVDWIPRGGRSAPLVSLGQRFLHATYSTATRVLDVKRDFRARGDGSTNDTLAIQRALDAAHRLGAGASVYFPSGTYRISKTLQVRPGAAYSIEGTGWKSQIVLTDPNEKVALRIDTPDGLTLTHIGVGSPSGSATVLHTATSASRAHYHNVFGYDHSERQDLYIVFDSLAAGSVVTTGHLDGRVIVRNSAQATILMGFLCSVQMAVEGTSPQSGSLGVLSRVSAFESFPLIVHDNRSLVMTDWYNEQSLHLSLIEGSAGHTGRVVVDHTRAASTAPVFMHVRGYRGLIAEFGAAFGVVYGDQPHVVTVRGGNSLEMVFAGNMFWFNRPKINGPISRTVLLGNSIGGRALQRNAVVPNRLGSGDAALCASALESFQVLGARDLLLNYGYTAP